MTNLGATTQLRGLDDLTLHKAIKDQEKRVIRKLCKAGCKPWLSIPESNSFRPERSPKVAGARYEIDNNFFRLNLVIDCA